MANDFHAADVWSLLAHWAEATPEAPAFLHGDRALSFADLHEQSLRAAQGLADLGVGPGDRVALWLPNLPAYPILYFACTRLGAIAVAVNTRYRAVEVADIVGRSGAKVLARSEEHTSELQSHVNLVCRLLLEKKKKQTKYTNSRT